MLIVRGCPIEVRLLPLHAPTCSQQQGWTSLPSGHMPPVQVKWHYCPGPVPLQLTRMKVCYQEIDMHPQAVAPSSNWARRLSSSSCWPLDHQSAPVAGTWTWPPAHSRCRFSLPSHASTVGALGNWPLEPFLRLVASHRGRHTCAHTHPYQTGLSWAPDPPAVSLDLLVPPVASCRNTHTQPRLRAASTPSLQAKSGLILIYRNSLTDAGTCFPLAPVCWRSEHTACDPRSHASCWCLDTPTHRMESLLLPGRGWERELMEKTAQTITLTTWPAPFKPLIVCFPH